MTHRYQPAVVVGSGITALAASGTGSEPASNGVYIDPHIVLLFFLAVSFLIYAVLLAIDMVTQRRQVDVTLEE